MKQHFPRLLPTRIALAAIFVVMPFVSVPHAAAIQTNGVANNVHYVASFQPLSRASIPFSGRLVLNYNNGFINGTYNDRSVQPNAPFANRFNTPVTGGVSGDDIHLTIGNALRFNGQVEGDTIAGSAFYRGRLFQFLAVQGETK
jgi:hypothetical protein